MNSKKEITPSDYWLQNPTTDNWLPTPACAYAEHRFLTFLRLLKHENLVRINEVTILSNYSLKRTNVITLKKISSLPINFGEDTHLVLTGHLAGTICLEIDPEKVIAFRPLTNHDRIEISLLKDKLVNRSLSSHLKQTKQEIQHFGIIPAILKALEDLNLDHDPENLIKNSKAYAKQSPTKI
jgi:hypothetical protein